MTPLRFVDEWPPSATDVDGESIRDREDLMTALATAMHFPDYFGRNWDAVDECLRDHPGDLVIRNAADLWRRLPREAAALAEIVASAAAEREPVSLVFVW